MLHSNITLGANHIIHNWEPADEAARLAIVVTASDIGKVARQQDTGDFYVLVDNSPLQWNVFGSASGAANATEMVAKNNTVSTINAFNAVYVDGASGQLPTINLAKADAELTSSKTIGITKAGITASGTGSVVLQGLLVDIDTSAFVDGALLWLSDSVAGGITNSIPVQPSHSVFLGYVVHSHATKGKVVVSIKNGYELDELHNVLITSPLDGSILVYDSATGLWVDSTLLAELDPQIADLAPLDYTGNGGKLLAVKMTEDGWELITVAGGGSPITAKDEGTSLTAGMTSINFVGAGVVASAVGNDVTVTVAGGLTNFTDSYNTAAPNATVPVAALSAIGAAANIDVALKPKGTGALLAQIPDNLTAGGNKRGANSVDWQTKRASASYVCASYSSVIAGGEDNITSSSGYQVIGGGFNNQCRNSPNTIAGGRNNIAAGTDATIGGGASNKAYGEYSTVAGGRSNYINSYTDCFVGGGNNNRIEGMGSVIVGGVSNYTQGPYTSILGGTNNRVDNTWSSNLGGNGGANRSRMGFLVHSSNPFAAQGDNQQGWLCMRTTTSDATPKVLSNDGNTPQPYSVVTLPNNTLMPFKGYVYGRQNATGDSSVWEISGVVKRGANEASTAFIGTPSVTLIAKDAGAAAWAIALSVDTAASWGSMKITVTGEAAKTIRWSTYLYLNELTG